MARAQIGTETRERFEAQGFLEPSRIFSVAECRALKAELLKAAPPLDWPKGHAANSVAFSRLGRDPRIVDRVVGLIGEDVMLWGASLVRRESGQIHPWHTDIETSVDTEGTVSVWIGLENTRLESSLFILPGSHKLGSSVQEEAFRAGTPRTAISADDIHTWARKLGGNERVIQPPVSDGEALFFDGRLWHGSHNASEGEERLAVLLQYARPDIPIQMPVPNAYEYPFKLQDTPRPPCIMVHGSTDGVANRILPSPTASSNESLSWYRSLILPGDDVTGFRAHGFHYGATRCLTYLDCHSSVLNTNHSPHPPHTHADEEILVVMNGEAELELEHEVGRTERHRVLKGSFAYYPAGQAHTIHNVAAWPVTYLMFRWNGREHERTPAGRGENRLPTGIFSYNALPQVIESDHRDGFALAEVFRGQTDHLPMLQCHHSVLEPGGGYEPHIDAYDVAIALLDGAVETLGRRVAAPAVIFYAAGEPHGIRNIGDVASTYLVFEFHATSRGQEATPLAMRLARLAPKPWRALIPKGLKRRIKRRVLRP